MTRIAWFVSAHGLGHAARTAAIAAELPPAVHVTVVSDFDRTFFDRRFRPGTGWRTGSFDAGCVQQDTLTIDRASTLNRAQECSLDNRARAEEWRSWLNSGRFDAVVCDVSPFPIALARSLGIPAFVVANFTWCSIYRAWPEAEGSVAEMESQYQMADRSFVPGPALDMPELLRRETFPWVAATGTPRREELASELGRTDSRIALVLPGAWGTPFDGNPSNAEGWCLVSLGAHGTQLPGVVALDPDRWPHADVVASVDVVLGKPGYGTVGECAMAGTPMAFVRRPDFAESRVLEDWMEANGFGMPIERDDYLACRWTRVFDRLVALPRPSQVPGGGARKVADAILAGIAGTRLARAESSVRDVNDHVRNSSEEKR
ncbi:MAG: hypothetical protein ACKO5K_07085 [Armatimonadota bacterium]